MDHAAVKADVARRERRHGGELRRQEVLLRDAVLIMQQRKHGELHAVAALTGIRHTADDDVECLAGDALLHGLAQLILAEVRQEVCDDKLRLVRLAADGDVDRAAVLERDRAVQLQRDRDPLPPKKQAGVKIQEETVADSTMRALAMIAEAKVL